MLEFLRLLNKPCEDMTRLISAAQDRELGRSERLAVRFHLLYCTACRRFTRQVRFLRACLRALIASEDLSNKQSAPTLSSEARDRIDRALTQE